MYAVVHREKTLNSLTAHFMRLKAKYLLFRSKPTDTFARRQNLARLIQVYDSVLSAKKHGYAINKEDLDKELSVWTNLDKETQHVKF